MGYNLLKKKNQKTKGKKNYKEGWFTPACVTTINLLENS
jgi:hypothetical protein